MRWWPGSRTRGGALDLGPASRRWWPSGSALYVAMEAPQAKRNAANEEMKRVAKEDPAGPRAPPGRPPRPEPADQGRREAARRRWRRSCRRSSSPSPTSPTPRCRWGPPPRTTWWSRTWGEAPALALHPPAALRDRREAGDARLRAGGQGVREPLRLLQGRAGAAGAGAGHLHDRRAHRRAATPSCSPRTWCPAATLTGTGQLPKFEEDVFKTAGATELLPHPHRRGPGHQLPRRRDPRRRRAPAALLRLQPLLPRRGRRGGQGHPRARSASTSSTRWSW